MAADDLARVGALAPALRMRDDATHVADVARTHAYVVGDPGMHPCRGEAVHHIDVVGIAHDTACIHTLARHGADRHLVAVVDLGLIFVMAVVVASVHAGIRLRRPIDVVLIVGEHTAILDLGVLRRAHERTQVQALAAQARDGDDGVVHRTASLDGAVVHVRLVEHLARDDARP